jgi:hypothetical protein
MEKKNLAAIGLHEHPIYEAGKTYWSGYWARPYTVLDVKTETHGENTVLNSVTVREEDGRIHSHSTGLDPQRDWELRDSEQAMMPPPLVGRVTFRYHHGEETINYTEAEKLLGALKEGLNTMGPNGVSVKVLSDDLELRYQVFALETGEYGCGVDKEKYFRLAKEYGANAPELMESIIDEPMMESERSEEDGWSGGEPDLELSEPEL